MGNNPPGYKRKRNYAGIWKCNNCKETNSVSRLECRKCSKIRSTEITK